MKLIKDGTKRFVKYYKVPIHQLTCKKCGAVMEAEGAEVDIDYEEGTTTFVEPILISSVRCMYCWSVHFDYDVIENVRTENRLECEMRHYSPSYKTFVEEVDEEKYAKIVKKC